MPSGWPNLIPPKRRSFPTPTQFAVLVTFYKYHTRRGNRTKRPSLRDVAFEHSIPHHSALYHIQALAKRGYLEQRKVWEHRSWELTPKGLKRAEQRWKLEKRKAKKKADAERAQRQYDKGWRKRMREQAKANAPTDAAS